MQKISGAFILINLLSLIYLFSSCEEGNVCQEDLESYAYIGFHKRVNGVLTDTVLGTLMVKGIQDPDTITFDTVFNRNSVELRLPQDADSCKYLFSIAVYDSILTQVNDSTEELTWTISHYVEDTLEISFTRQLYLLSPNCGFSYLYELTDINYTKNSIQSAEIGIAKIGGFNEENIKILF
ncbi:MAG: DUF6452 family protein [Bacteroidales bacterium]|jgi:hypothetical protein